MNAAFSILWQCMDLEDDSKLVKDNQKSLALLLVKLSKENGTASSEIQKVVSAFVTIGSPRAIQPKKIPIDTNAARILSSMPAPVTSKQKTTKKQLQAIASRFAGFGGKDAKNDSASKRKVVSPQIATTQLPGLDSQYARAGSTVSLASTQSAPAMQLSTPSPRSILQAVATNSAVNLDYFPLEVPLSLSSHNSSTTMLPPIRKQQSAPAGLEGWESLQYNGEPAHQVLYNTIEPTALNKCVSNPETEWTDDLWNLTSFAEKAPVPQSLLSFSEESLTSGDDFVFSTAGSHHGSMSTHDDVEYPPQDDTFKGIAMPVSSLEDDIDFSVSVRR